MATDVDRIQEIADEAATALSGAADVGEIRGLPWAPQGIEVPVTGHLLYLGSSEPETMGVSGPQEHRWELVCWLPSEISGSVHEGIRLAQRLCSMGDGVGLIRVLHDAKLASRAHLDGLDLEYGARIAGTRATVLTGDLIAWG